jgi:N-acetylneuraminic acid mutarotase
MRSLNKVKMSMVWIGVFCVGFVSPLRGQPSAAGGIWTTKSPMQRARLVLCSSAVDGKIYAIGGSPDFPATAWVEAYDPATDTWIWKTDMPTTRSTATSSVVNGKIYVIGGVTDFKGVPLSTVEQYDPATDTWTTKANMPTARGMASSSVVDGKIYVFGGALIYQGTSLSTVEQYDPATDTWTSKADMPTPTVWPSASAVNGRIYVIGGSAGGPGASQWYQGTSTVEEYDPATDTWTPKADMPTARTALSTSVVNGRIYAIGGRFGNNSSAFSTVEEYDPATDTWTPKADMPTQRLRMTTSVVNGKIYAIGGSGTSGGPDAIATVEEYDPYPVVVDFNGDGIVDGADLLALVACWGTDDLLCDIGPMPGGDGVVDVEDLTVLAEYIGAEVDDPTLMAHWAFDETAGDVAYDSRGTNDGILLGEPVWESQGGMVNGALGFDGSDDSMATSEDVLNPAAGPFSIVAWIKGGAAGQVIASEVDDADWLVIDALTGTLATELTPPAGRASVPPLVSDWIVTDGFWHRIAFVWDGGNRSLYVDGVPAAMDEQEGLAGSDGGLYIGCGADQSPGSFFSGLIDEVRIYNRAVRP